MDRHVDPFRACVCVDETDFASLIGYGIAGILRPLLVWPRRAIYPWNIPNIALFQSLHGDKDVTRSQLNTFKKAFCLVALWEVSQGLLTSPVQSVLMMHPNQVVPQWIAPALQTVAPFCLVTAPDPMITYLFGGSSVSEGARRIGAKIEDMIFTTLLQAWERLHSRLIGHSSPTEVRYGFRWMLKLVYSVF
jgi:hypothetical protein